MNSLFQGLGSVQWFSSIDMACFVIKNRFTLWVPMFGPLGPMFGPLVPEFGTRYHKWLVEWLVRGHLKSKLKLSKLTHSLAGGKNY